MVEMKETEMTYKEGDPIVLQSSLSGNEEKLPFANQMLRWLLPEREFGAF